MLMAGSRVAAPFNGNFASLFTPGTVLQSVQTDLGLTYGGTLLATGTTPPVITLTGTLAGAPTAITVTDTLPGILGTWTGLVTYGDNSTQAFTSAAAVALTGKGAGLTLNIAAGAAAGDNTWKATCSGLADQSGNGKNYSQATASTQPLIAVGVNGIASLLFDGVDDVLTSTLTLPAPGTTPSFAWVIYRYIDSVAAANHYLLSDSTGGQLLLYSNSGAAVTEQFNNSNANPVAIAFGTFTRDEAYFSNSASDYHKSGGTTASGTNAGNAAGGTRSIAGPVSFGHVEVLALVYTNTLPSGAQLAALSAAVTSKYGSGVSV